MGEKGSSPVGIGVISIITILLVLCLTIFAALTLSSAKADLALSEKNAQTVRTYYDADARAAKLYEEFAAGGEELLAQHIPITDDQSIYLELARNGDGSVRVVAWRTQLEESGMEFEETLPVWGGE